MASNINSTGVDATFPIAGQDNDSQGFRNNFNTIKNNFTAAKSEIEALQTNTAKLNAANNFLGNDVSGANLIANTEKVYAGGTVTSPQNISFTNGNYQTFTIGNNIFNTDMVWRGPGRPPPPNPFTIGNRNFNTRKGVVRVPPTVTIFINMLVYLSANSNYAH